MYLKISISYSMEILVVNHFSIKGLWSSNSSYLRLPRDDKGGYPKFTRTQTKVDRIAVIWYVEVETKEVYANHSTFLEPTAHQFMVIFSSTWLTISLLEEVVSVISGFNGKYWFTETYFQMTYVVSYFINSSHLSARVQKYTVIQDFEVIIYQRRKYDYLDI
jgi:hypothetical protein